MAENAPNGDFRAAGEPIHPTLERHTLEEFKQLMENVTEAQKVKNKANKAKKQQERLGKNKSMVDQFKRAQRYLGLRDAIRDPSLSGSSPAIDPSTPAPFPFDQSVVFVCVDVESYERAHHKITEVGVATLDTRELVGVPPGEDGKTWRGKVRARHFRINEHRHLVNSDFVTGHPDGFEFGNSTFVPLKEAAHHVATCFHAPFGAQDGDDFLSHYDPTEKRNIIFLGHDTLSDVRYLQQLGYDPMKVENILEAMDTAIMYRVWNREQQPSSLGRILQKFDIAGWNLHNAGNDAVYTVQAMLAICVREATIRGSTELDNLRENEKAARLQTALEDAEQRVMDDAEGWSDHEATGDGGVPVPLAPALAPKPTQPKAQTIPQYDGTPDFGTSSGRVQGSLVSEGSQRSRGYRTRGGQRGGTRQRASRGRVQMDGHDQPGGGSKSRGRAYSQLQGRGIGRDSSDSPRNVPASEAIPQVQYHW
jgi:hypothetical protein